MHVDLPIDEDAPGLWPRELFLCCGTSVDQQSLDGQIPFMLGKKVGCLGVVWEVDDGYEAEEYCWKTL